MTSLNRMMMKSLVFLMMVMVVTVTGRGAIRNIGNGGHDGGELFVKSSSWF